MRILCYILVVLFVTTSAVGQQINPVPDYIFRNSMSVGRNAPTDTSAYFSIGPRFGATRGFMPPMVVDTAAVTGTKRNGLLIYSIQRNSFLYWDSTGMRWSRIAANLDTLQLATRAWRQKGDDSLAARINTRTDTLLIATRAWRQKGLDSVSAIELNISDTATMLSPYVRIAGVGLSKSSQTLNADTLTLSTRLWRNKGMDSIRSIITSSTDTNTISTRAWRQKGVDSVASVRIGGSGTLNYVPKFSASTTIANSQIFDNGTSVGINTTTPSPTYRLQVGGNQLTVGRSEINNGTETIGFSNPIVSGTTGDNVYLSNVTGGGLTGTGNQASYNVVIGFNSGNAMTTGAFNTSTGSPSLQSITTGSGNTAFGSFATNSVTTGNENTGIGTAALGGVTTASGNTGVGREALGTLTTGSQNTSLGWSAGRYRSTSQSNSRTINSLYIGYDTRSSADSVNNEIVIGASAIGLGSNSVVLGNSSITNTYLRGKTLVNTTTDAGYQFDVAGSMRNTTDAYFNTSSGETYIGTTSDAGAFRLQVNGVARASDGLATGAPTGGTAATWKLGTVATVSPTSPNRTIEVEIGGTIYYIHAKTTND